jgi:hypothetical protein
MKKLFVLFGLLFFTSISLAQKSDSICIVNKDTIVTDSHTGAPILIGYCNRQAFNDTSFSWWFESMYDLYNVDSLVANECAPKLKKVDITIVMGTWCSDSRREVPRLFKILDYLKYPSDKVTIIAIDRDKKGRGDDIKNLKIELIPTIIFYRDKKEIGRIVESPKVSLEKDMLKILEG